MLESKSQAESLLDQMFLENPATDDFLASQIADANAALKKIDRELSDSLLQNIKLIDRLSVSHSLPVADRYALVPIKAVHDKDCAILRILLDDLKELMPFAETDKEKRDLALLRKECFNLLSSATQYSAILQAGIQGSPVSDAMLDTDISVQ